MNMNIRDIFDCYSDESTRLEEAPAVSDDRVCSLTNTKLGRENIIVKKVYRKLPIVLVAVMAVVLLMGAGFVAASDSIDGWFKTRWEEVTGEEMSDEHYETIASLSQYIGLSETSDGVTVSVDSAAVGDDVVYVLITAECDSGKFTTVGTSSFGIWEVDVNSNRKGGGMGRIAVDESGKAYYLDKINIMSFDNDEPLDVSIHLGNLNALIYSNEDGSPVWYSGDGEWSFEFTLERTETNSIDLTDKLPWTGVTKLTVTEFGVIATYDNASDDVPRVIRYNHMKVYAVMEDGTEYQVNSASSSGSTGIVDYYCFWEVPVDLDEVVAIRIGEEIIEIQ
ncbi:MAG: hypothetical protein LUG86_05315 [Oscillospiraceae bacterium]|nr:hypothetical protein [Oscillospiraceae bacterium]